MHYALFSKILNFFLAAGKEHFNPKINHENFQVIHKFTLKLDLKNF